MTFRVFPIAAAIVAATGCSGSADHSNVVGAANQAAPANSAQADMAEPTASAPAADPTSPAAAAAVIDDYAALVDKGAFAAAARDWTNATAAAQFAATLEDYPKVRLTAGKPVDEEGAAGSIFITVPLTLDLTLRSGSPYQMQCKATLRRINDVPGSTADQRRWHIESIAC